ncbi:MAG TPA: phosphatase PAP2 family protein [Bacteroidia bacterium]|nr:phosphatase PAP2 family protein [Bacteroidia bacterium]
MSAFDAIVEVDHQLFFYLNNAHLPWLDTVMFALSNKLIWIPLYAWLLYLIYKKYKNGTVIILVCTVGLIFFSDQTANVFKEIVQRYRPTHNATFGQFVHTVNDYRGGTYGFFSSHAANAFALMLYVLLLLKPCPKLLKLTLISYACLTSYSRIYLGVHYPTDIIAGAFCGLGLGFLFYNFTKVILEKWNIKLPS